MALFKRRDSPNYWYEFERNGVRYRESTGTSNIKAARDIEADAKTKIALRGVGLPARTHVPMLLQFIDHDFLPSVVNMKARTKQFYEHHAGILRESTMGPVPLDHITVQMIEAFAFNRRKKYSVATVNRDLSVLRRIFHLAIEARKIQWMPKVKMLKGENRRERVVSPEEEAAYLEKAAPLLKDVATLLFDLGLRPEECFRLRLENFRDKFCHVFYGKREGSRRRIPCSARVLEVVARRTEGGNGRTLLFSTVNKAGVQRPIDGSSIKKQHAAALKKSKVEAFVIYSIRHTCITRWSFKVDPFTLRQLAGHLSIQTTERYVHHVSDDHLKAAIA
jgi:integrase